MKSYVIRCICTLALAAAPFLATAATRTITFIELNDLHAHLVPHLEVVSDGIGGTKVERRGGLTRIATAVKDIRADNPNSILMNIGDTYHGGAEAFYTVGNAVSDPLNSLGVDVGVPGNWDFYYSPPMVRARYGQIDTNRFTDRFTVSVPGFGTSVEIKRPNFVNLGANVTDIMNMFFPQDFLPATHMMTVDGIKVGFIGLTSDIVGDMHDMLTQGFDFASGETEHKDLVNQHAAALRNQGADIVVVMSELGIHKTRQLADVVNSGVDVFFAAHTHEVTYQPIESASGALVVEAGDDGYLGRMDVTVSTSRWRGNSISGMQWSIIDLDDSVPEDPDMLTLVNAERAPFFEDNVALTAPPPFFMQNLGMPLDTVIGHTDSLMDRKDSLESTFNNGYTDMLRSTTGTEVAMTPGFRMGTTVTEPGYMDEIGHVATGDITLEDAYRFIPMLYGIATATTSGARLKEIVEEQLTKTYSSDAFNHTGGWNYGFSGLDMDLDLAGGDGSRIRQLAYSDTGAPVGDTDTVTVTGCQRLPLESGGTLCAYDGFDNITSYTGLLAADETVTALDLFVDMLASNTFNGNRSDISDANNTPRWPDSDFIQPLDGVGSSTGAADGNNCGYFGMCNSGFGGGFRVFGFGVR